MMSAYCPASPVVHSITSRQTWVSWWSMSFWESVGEGAWQDGQHVISDQKGNGSFICQRFKQSSSLYIFALTVHRVCTCVKSMLRLWSCYGPCSPRQWSGASSPAPSPPSRPSSRRPWPEGRSRSLRTRLQRLALLSRSQGKRWRLGREPEKTEDLWNLEQMLRLREWCDFQRGDANAMFAKPKITM